MKYIIQGAGAIGSAIGGFLAKAGFEVTLVSRKAHVEAIKKQNGIFLHTLNGIELQPVNASENMSGISFTDDTVIFQTMKAHDTKRSLNDLDGVDPGIPIVCWQNGVDSEAMVSNVFRRVYGGVVRFTGTMMTPGETNFAGTGKLILGQYPEGVDGITEKVAADLGKTPFTIITSNNIMQDKWLKLLVNLMSCVKPMVKDASQNLEKRIVICRNALKEGVRVLDITGIRAISTNNTEDSPEKMLENFDNALKLAEGAGQGMELQNSTWQSLAKCKKELENDWYTGKVITLGREHGIPTPYNEAILFYLHLMADKDMGPESIDVDDILTKAKELSEN